MLPNISVRVLNFYDNRQLRNTLQGIRLSRAKAVTYKWVAALHGTSGKQMTDAGQQRKSELKCCLCAVT